MSASCAPRRPLPERLRRVLREKRTDIHTVSVHHVGQGRHDGALLTVAAARIVATRVVATLRGLRPSRPIHKGTC